MSANYVKLTANTMTQLPEEKQLEVYDFVNFLRTSTKMIQPKKVSKKTSLLKLIGIGSSGKTDISLNHDKYLYE